MNVDSTVMRPRVLITGGTGWLAQYIYKAMCPEYDGSSMATQFDIHVTYRETSERPHWVPEGRTHVMHLAGAQCNVEDVIEGVAPQCIIHCAGVSAIAACEKNSAALEINSPICLIEAINKHVPDAVVVFLSTVIVYAGRDEPYEELDPNGDEMVNQPPLCQYGRSKLNFERLLVSSVKNYVVIRCSNAVGPDSPFRSATGVRFLDLLEKSAKERKPIELKIDEIRSYVDVRDVAKVIQKIVDTPKPNSLLGAVYNVGGPKGLSRVDLAIAVARARGIPIQVVDKRDNVIYSTEDQFESSDTPWIIHAIHLSEFLDIKHVPLVPHTAILDSSKIELACGFRFRTVEEMLTTVSTYV